MPTEREEHLIAELEQVTAERDFLVTRLAADIDNAVPRWFNKVADNVLIHCIADSPLKAEIHDAYSLETAYKMVNLAPEHLKQRMLAALEYYGELLARKKERQLRKSKVGFAKTGSYGPPPKPATLVAGKSGGRTSEQNDDDKPEKKESIVSAVKTYIDGMMA